MTPVADLKRTDCTALAETIDAVPRADLQLRVPLSPHHDVLDVEWTNGDAEALPFEDETFDVVLSTFGVQFAPRHHIAADELIRVCRRGGRIGLVSWTPDGHIGQFFKLMGRYLPAGPRYASPPPLWGSPAHVRSLFAGAGIAWEFDYGHNPWMFASAEEWTTFMECDYGPTAEASRRLKAEGRWDECRRELVALAGRCDEGIRSEYLVAVGTLPG